MSGGARTIIDIDADIAAAEQRLRDLHAERRANGKARIAAIVADFDNGLTFEAISRVRKLPYYTVQGILWRAGRTEKTRANIRSRARHAQLQDLQPVRAPV